jgi:hypothetical protein
VCILCVSSLQVHCFARPVHEATTTTTTTTEARKSREAPIVVLFFVRVALRDHCIALCQHASQVVLKLVALL